MYRPGRTATTKVNREPAFVEAAENSGGESDVEAVGAEQQPDTLVSDVDTQQHLTKDMFFKAQEIELHIDVTASPAQMQQNPDKRLWNVAPWLHAQLKQNLATMNRDRATEDQLAGRLERCIVLHFEPQEKMNGFPYFMGIEVPGMLNKALHSKGACAVRVPPHTALTQAKATVFEPTNIVDAFMYDQYKLCTVEDLANDIKFVKGTSKAPAHAMIAVGSLAHVALKDNLEDPDNWSDQRHDIDEEHILNPGKKTAAVQVTEKIGKDLRNLLRPPIEKAAASFVNLANFNIRFVRADGNDSFVSPNSINGELMADTAVNAPVMRTEIMQRACTFAVVAKMTYILF